MTPERLGFITHHREMEACVDLDKMPYMVGATFKKGVLPSKVPQSSAVSIDSFTTYLLTPGMLIKL